jgi:hypothetical protein
VTPGSLAATAAGRWWWLVAGTPMVASGATSGVGVNGRRSRQERTQDRENSDDLLEPCHLIPSFSEPKSRNGPVALTPPHAPSVRSPTRCDRETPIARPMQWHHLHFAERSPCQGGSGGGEERGGTANLDTIVAVAVGHEPCRQVSHPRPDCQSSLEAAQAPPDIDRSRHPRRRERRRSLDSTRVPVKRG